MRYGGTPLEAGLLLGFDGVVGDEVLAPIGDGVPVPVGLIPLPPPGEVVAGGLGPIEPAPKDGVPVGGGVIPTPEMFVCAAVVLGRVLVGPPKVVPDAGEVDPAFEVAGVAWSLLPEPKGINGVPVPTLSDALVRTIDG